MVTQPAKKTNSFIFLVILVIALGLAINSLNNLPKSEPKQENTANQPNPETSSNQGGMDIETGAVLQNQDQYIYYSIHGSGFTDIYRYRFNNGENIKIFTDRDEDEKIKAISGLVDKKSLVQSSRPEDEFISNIYLISLDGSGKKEKKFAGFSSPQAPILSPDGKRVAYIIFSNAESDFGFKLLVSDLDGKNKQELSNDQTNLILYSWSPSGKLLSFGKGQDNDIFQINLDNNQQEKILSSSGEQIYSAVFTQRQNQYLVSKGPKGNNLFNQSEIYLYENGKFKQITSDKVYNYSIFVIADDQYLFINKDYDINDQESNSQPGKIMLFNLKSNSLQEINTASQIIGWSN